MDPWFGVFAGLALVVLGVAVVRSPDRWLHFSDAGFRLGYQLAEKHDDGSRAHRFSLAVARAGGAIAIIAGSAFFIGGIVLLVIR